MTQMSAAANSATPTNSLKRREMVDPATLSDLHDDGQHEGPPPRTFAEKAAQFDAQLLLDEPLIGAFLDAGLIHEVAQHARAVREQRLAVFHHEAASDDVGDTLERPGLFVDGHDGHDETVFREVAPVAEDLVNDLARERAVDEDTPHGRLAGDTPAVAVENDDVAIFR